MRLLPNMAMTRISPSGRGAVKDDEAGKTSLGMEQIAAVAKALETGSSDLASLEKTRTPGYAAPKSFTAHVMSTNPDGSIGISTITQWKYSDEVFNAGKFNSYYSGKTGQKSQYTITCEVLGIEEVSASVKLGLAFN